MLEILEIDKGKTFSEIYKELKLGQSFYNSKTMTYYLLGSIQSRDIIINMNSGNSYTISDFENRINPTDKAYKKVKNGTMLKYVEKC